MGQYFTLQKDGYFLRPSFPHLQLMTFARNHRKIGLKILVQK